MEILQVIITALVSIVVLFLLAKLMGNKQIDQLSMFDYIVGITIGSIASDLATELQAPVYPLIALLVYGLTATLISVLTNKSIVIRRAITGQPLLLLDNGKLFRENFKKARLDLNDFLSLARVAGYYSLQSVESAVLEENGRVSFLPKSQDRPVTPADMKIYPAQEHIQVNLVMDGQLMEQNLEKTGRNENWLRGELRGYGYTRYEGIFLACLDSDGSVTVYAK